MRRLRPIWSRLVPVGLVTLAMAAGSGGMAAEVDPFYDSLLRQGAAAYDRGDFEEAAKRLRVACFGLMDEPAVLADALVRLALAQSAMNDRQAFGATFERIAQVEELFAGYSQAPLPAEVRSQFETQLIERVPMATLRGSATFSRLVRNKELLQLQSLPPAQRRAQLESMVRESPNDPDWRRMLAEAQVAGGDGRQAIDALQQEVLARPADGNTRCLLARAHLQAGRCELSSDNIERCDVRALPAPELTRHIDCLTGAERWLEAASVVVSLPPAVRTSRPLVKREKRIARALPPDTEIPPLAPFVADARVASPPAGTTSRATSQPAAQFPTRVPESAVQTLRERLTAAASREELASIADDAEHLGKRYPASREALYIAGEAAYKVSNWSRAARNLAASGGPPAARPELLFYLSVSFFELGDRDQAARILQQALPNLQRTAIVQRYVRDILGNTG
ncbi:MAG: hypothetical protein O7A98_09680 [Acidobacteria bacterium]|nr:hypothetical protein [Acidobacteriota bacterium]